MQEGEIIEANIGKPTVRDSPGIGTGYFQIAGYRISGRLSGSAHRFSSIMLKPVTKENRL
jgi:hypothetical protein